MMGPEPPPSKARSKPEWVRILEEDAAVDEEVAELLQGTNSDPEKIRAKMQAKLATPAGAPEIPFQARTGSDTPPRITFREVDVFDMWVWLELLVPPSEREKELLTSTIKSWFVVGKLGGFNSGNLQVYYNNSDDNSFLDYDNTELGGAYRSYMHECSDPEFKGSWARFHIDMGTADELALDVLLNMLLGFSAEVAGLSRIMVGGEHERWALPGDEEDGEEGEAGQRRRKEQQGDVPKVGMNPMKLPEGVAEELELLDELGKIYGEEVQQQAAAKLAGQGGLRPVNPGQKTGPGLRPITPGQVIQPNTQRSSSGVGRLRQQQQQQQSMQGLRTYSPDEFKKAFNVREVEEDDKK